MTQSWYVGPQLVPVESAGDNTALRDPTIVGLLDYFAFWLKLALDAKLAEMGGPTTSAAITDACPAGHRFGINHMNTFMRKWPVDGVMSIPLPGLWLWQESKTYTKEGATLWYAANQRMLKLHWVFPELKMPDGYQAREGIWNAASVALDVACDKGLHPDWFYGDHPAGVSLLTALDLHSVELVTSQHLCLAITPNATSQSNGGVAGNQGAEQRFFPCLEATLKVVERVGQREAVFPQDSMGDSLLTYAVGDDVNDTVDTLERVVPGPDDLVP